MGARINSDIMDFIALFRDTWAECQAFRAKQRIEASGNNADWGECLRSAQIQADELFRPIFSDLQHGIPLPQTLKQVQQRLEDSSSPVAPEVMACESPQLR